MPSVDDIALRLYLCRVEERLLTYAAETRALRTDLDTLGYVDEGMAHARAKTLDGLGEFRRDDMMIILPQTRVGRLLLWFARMTARIARAIG